MPDKEQQVPEPEPQPDDPVNPDTSDPRLISRVQEADEPDSHLVSYIELGENLEDQDISDLSDSEEG